MITYSIKDLERLSGIKAHTIRIWEKRYNFIIPKRTKTNIRYYDNDDLKHLLNAAALKRHGHKISVISDMSKAEMAEAVIEMTAVESDEALLIDDLIIAMIEFNARRFDKTINNAIIRMGFEETVIKVIYPFFVKIGYLWQVKSINTAQEHFISNLIREKFIVAINDLDREPNPKGKHFILFLPDGELHELGLLFYNYVIVKTGHKVLYLGQSVPLECVVQTISQLSIDYIVTSIHSVFSEEDFIKKLSYIADQIPNIPIILTNRIDFDITSVNIDRLYANLEWDALNEMLKIDTE